MKHDWSFAQMRAARDIIRDRYYRLMPIGYISPGYTPKPQEVEVVLQTILLSGKSFSDLLSEAEDWSRGVK